MSLSIQNTRSKQFTLPQNVNVKWLNEKKRENIKTKKYLKLKTVSKHIHAKIDNKKTVYQRIIKATLRKIRSQEKVRFHWTRNTRCFLINNNTWTGPTELLTYFYYYLAGINRLLGCFVLDNKSEIIGNWYKTCNNIMVSKDRFINLYQKNYCTLALELAWRLATWECKMVIWGD